MAKIYQFTATDRFNYHPKWMLQHFRDKMKYDEFICFFGNPKYLKELRKLRTRKKGAVIYTYAVYGKYK